jgi:hypothetical protein
MTTARDRLLQSPAWCLRRDLSLSAVTALVSAQAERHRLQM